MYKWVKTKDGRLWVLWSDNAEDETMDLIPAKDCDSLGRYDNEWICCELFNYSDILIIDTNKNLVENFKG